MLDLRNFLTEDLSRGGLHGVTPPDFQRRSGRAGRVGPLASVGKVIEPCAVGAKAWRLAQRLQRGEGNLAALQHRVALRRVVPQRRNLGAGRPARFVAQVERGPRIAARLAPGEQIDQRVLPRE